MKPSKAKPKKRAVETAIVTTTTMVNEKQISRTCRLVHSQYDEGLVYYQIEDDKELNFVLHSVSCGLCSIAFGVNANECRGLYKSTCLCVQWYET